MTRIAIALLLDTLDSCTEEAAVEAVVGAASRAIVFEGGELVRYDEHPDPDVLFSPENDTGGFPSVDDLDDEDRCPHCQALLWRDHENDVVHVLMDDGRVIGLSLLCNSSCACRGYGYLTDQTYGETDPPPEATLIQRCDECSKYEGDLDAAVAYAAAETAHTGRLHVVHAIGYWPDGEDGEVLFWPHTDPWVLPAVEGDEQLVIWHRPKQAAEAGWFTWTAKCMNCDDPIEYVELDGEWTWQSERDTGLTCNNSVEQPARLHVPGPIDGDD